MYADRRLKEVFKLINISKYISIFLLMSLLSACMPAVHSDFDRTFNFSALKSYALMPTVASHTGTLMSGPLISKNISQALQDALAAKGYSKSTHPDFYVRYRLTSRAVIRSSPRLGYGLGYFGGNMGLGMYGGGYAEQYEMAVLTISIYDGQNQSALLWRGVTEKAMSSASTGADYINSLIKELITAVLNKFPPKKK